MYSKDVTVTATLSWVEKASVQSHSKQSKRVKEFSKRRYCNSCCCSIPSFDVGLPYFFVSLMRGHKIWTLVISYKSML
jgi:hypothetical protein